MTEIKVVSIERGVLALTFNGSRPYRYVPNPYITRFDINQILQRFITECRTDPEAALLSLKNRTVCFDSKDFRKHGTPISSLLIKSFTTDQIYVVSKHSDGEWSCTCPDHQIRGRECKHIRSTK